jgi:hypothetical protein
VKGLRTFIAGLFALVCLVVGLYLLAAEHRHEAYFAFAGAVVGVMTTLFAKSVGTAAAGGEGLKGIVKNLTTDSKPGGQ